MHINATRSENARYAKPITNRDEMLLARSRASEEIKLKWSSRSRRFEWRAHERRENAKTVWPIERDRAQIAAIGHFVRNAIARNRT